MGRLTGFGGAPPATRPDTTDAGRPLARPTPPGGEGGVRRPRAAWAGRTNRPGRSDEGRTRTRRIPGQGRVHQTHLTAAPLARPARARSLVTDPTGRARGAP